MNAPKHMIKDTIPTYETTIFFDISPYSVHPVLMKHSRKTIAQALKVRLGLSGGSAWSSEMANRLNVMTLENMGLFCRPVDTDILSRMHPHFIQLFCE